MLVRLVYASRARVQIDDIVVDDIIAKSRRNNGERGITGVLCFSGDVFAQVVEGGRDAVNSLYSRLHDDARHDQLTLLQYEEIEARAYPAWSMARVGLDKVNRSLLLTYSTGQTLDPWQVPGGCTAALLQALAAAGVPAKRDGFF